MKTKFGPNLDFQREAVNAVVDLFNGQEVYQTNFTVALLKKEEGMFAGLDPSETPGSMDFTVEMETGTGKTYV